MGAYRGSSMTVWVVPVPGSYRNARPRLLKDGQRFAAQAATARERIAPTKMVTRWPSAAAAELGGPLRAPCYRPLLSRAPAGWSFVGLGTVSISAIF
jgi:hypothetical protein